MLSPRDWGVSIAAGVGSRDVKADGKVKNTGTVDTDYRVILAIGRHAASGRLEQSYSDSKDVTLAPGITSDLITLEVTGIVTVAGQYLLMTVKLNSRAPVEGELEVTAPPWRFDEPIVNVDGELVGDWTPAVS